MELIGRISKGSKMDQIYLPKNRAGLSNGQYVLISPLESKFKKKQESRHFFYNVENIEPLKIKTQVIKSASEAAEMILRIDDVITSKTPSMPRGGPPGGMGGMGEDFGE